MCPRIPANPGMGSITEPALRGLPGNAIFAYSAIGYRLTGAIGYVDRETAR
jgi:hypothetical protein